MDLKYKFGLVLLASFLLFFTSINRQGGSLRSGHVYQGTGFYQSLMDSALNGMFNQNFLPNSTVIQTCMDEHTASTLFDFMTAFYMKGSKANAFEILNLVINETSYFYGNLSYDTRQCLSGHPDMIVLLSYFGIDDTTDLTVLQKKITSYILFHNLNIHKQFIEVNTTWTNRRFFEAGYNSSLYLHPWLK